MKKGSFLLCFFMAIVLVSLIWAQEGESNAKWEGKYTDGRPITEDDLMYTLELHNIWVETSGADLSGANLCMADLRGANLRWADLSGADLCMADLRGANLRGANLSGANLSDAVLYGANLTEAVLSGAKLSGADLTEADLSRANFGGADLSGANLYRSIFEVKPLPVTTHIASALGLESLRFRDSPRSLVELRGVFKNAGFREQERKITCAIKSCETERLLEKKKGMWDRIEGSFNYVMFEVTCDYGMTPGRLLRMIVYFILFFSLPYMVALRMSRTPTRIVMQINKILGRCPVSSRRTGIWVVRMPDSVISRAVGGMKFGITTRQSRYGVWNIRLSDSLIKNSRSKFRRLTTAMPFRGLPENAGVIRRIIRGIRCSWRVFRIALYFSIVSAFSIGWKDLNVGNWLNRLQRREYALRATGWVRTVSGLQSLISVYLLALWVLSYFGRPFE